jgi:hypothetical protein
MKNHILKKERLQTNLCKQMSNKNKNRKEKTKCTKEQFVRNSPLLEKKMIKKEQREQN